MKVTEERHGAIKREKKETKGQNDRRGRSCEADERPLLEALVFSSVRKRGDDGRGREGRRGDKEIL